MSGKFDKFVIKSGLVKEEDVKHEYKIRICKDRTITITKGDEKPFNGVAIAVLSVPTREEAESLIIFVGKLQWVKCTITGKDWYKFMPGMEWDLLEYEDLPRVTAQLKTCLNHMRGHRTKPLEFETV